MPAAARGETVSRVADLSRGPSASALPDASGGSSEGTLPRVFMWLVDVAVLTVALLAAHSLGPRMDDLFVSHGFARLVPWLAIPETPEIGLPVPVYRSAWLLLVMVPVVLVTVDLLGGYRPTLLLTRLRIIVASLGAALAGAGAVSLFVFLLRQDDTRRAVVVAFVCLSGCGLAAWRLLLRTYRMRRARAGVYVRRVAVIGTAAGARWMRTYFLDNVPPTHYQLVGYLSALDDPREDRPEDLEWLGNAFDLGRVLIRRPIHEIIVLQDGHDTGWLNYVLETCDYFRITVRIVPQALLRGELRDLKIRFRSAALMLPEVVLSPKHLGSEALFVKRLLDVVLSALALLLLSPVFALIALGIKLTTPRLPVLYPWRVVGFNGQPFTGYKFTTMEADADDRKAELEHLNEMSGPVFKIKNDPRVTRFGRFLRKYSLNELPQLWSVLKGDMSLVGPRPAFPHELERFELWHKRKLTVRPGMTCLWQVRGRNAISDFDDWVRMDLEYIDHWSVSLDVKILFWTVWAVVAGTGS